MISLSSCSTIKWMTCPIPPLSKTLIVSRSPSRGLLLTTGYLVIISGRIGWLPIPEDRPGWISMPPKKSHSPSTMRRVRFWNPDMSNLTQSPGRDRIFNIRSLSMGDWGLSSMLFHTMRTEIRGLLRILTTWGRILRILNSISLSMRRPSRRHGGGCKRTPPNLLSGMSSTLRLPTMESRRAISLRTRV